MKMKLLPKKKKSHHRNHSRNPIESSVSIDVEINDTSAEDDFSEEARYFHCPTCGLMIERGSDHCDYCGTCFDASGHIISNSSADKTRFFIKKKKAIIITAAAILLGGTGLNAGIDYATQITVPDVNGMTAVEALDTLHNAGFEADDISIYCDSSLSEEDVKDGEYEVTYQSLGEGSKVHSDDGIKLGCKDLYKERTDAIASLRYDKADNAIDTAEKYGYSLAMANIEKDEGFEDTYKNLTTAEKTDYYVYDVTAVNDDERQAVLVVDSKENIESEMDRLFEKCVDKHVSEAEDIADALDVELECLDYDKQNVSAQPTLVVTSVKEVDFNTKQVVLNTDTEQHIEDLRIIPTLKDKIPYKGLSLRYLSDTAIGEYDRAEDEDDDYDLNEDETAYYWESKDGKYDVLKVICKGDKVKKVKRLYKKVYWTADLPDFSADKDAYDERVAAAAAKKAAEKKAREEAKQANEQMVWVSASGNCYHSHSSCSNMNDPWQVPISQAKNMGRRACKKCY